MTLQRAKPMIAVVWVLGALLVGILVGVNSVGGLALLAGFGLLPPLVMLLRWHDPAQTLSESIDKARH